MTGLMCLSSTACLEVTGLLSRRSVPGVFTVSSRGRRCFRRGRLSFSKVYCDSEEQCIWKCSPILESKLLASSETPSSNEWKAVPDIWKTSADKYGDQVALVDPYHDPPTSMTYKQLEQAILDFSEGLRVSGIFPDDKVALFADNSCRWLVSDQGIMATGAINVVRGSRSSAEELFQIFNHSESVALVVDTPELFAKLAGSFHSSMSLRFIVLLWGEKSSLDTTLLKDVRIYTYKEIIDCGQNRRASLSASRNDGEVYVYKPICGDDVATLVYTSGTTGIPKGVMLTHQNLLHQIRNLWEIVPAKSGDRFLSMLPPWHMYERAAEYFIFTYGVQQVYTTVKNLKEDLQKYQPHYVISVPLVYETLYSGIYKQINASSKIRKFIALLFIKISLTYMGFRKAFEGKELSNVHNELPAPVSLFVWLWGGVMAAFLWPFHVLGKKLVYAKIHATIGISKAGISGGGSLPLHVDMFFEAIGIRLQNGYGLTETSPVVSARRPQCNVIGTVGHAIRGTEIKITDAETGADVPVGSKGIVKVRGPQVMKGYYKNPFATIRILDNDGWIDTGDIGWIVPSYSTGPSRLCGGMLVLEGRAKDTIVLTTGENVEPSELEEAAKRSNIIQQIVVVGQDRRRLGALIVPDKEQLLSAARQKSDDSITAIDHEVCYKLVRDELLRWTSDYSFQVGPFLLLDEPFTVDNGLLTPTFKIRRDMVASRYNQEIGQLYK